MKITRKNEMDLFQIKIEGGKEEEDNEEENNE